MKAFKDVVGSVTVEQLHELSGQKNKHSELAISYSPYLHSALLLGIQFELASHYSELVVHELGHAWPTLFCNFPEADKHIVVGEVGQFEVHPQLLELESKPLSSDILDNPV